MQMTLLLGASQNAEKHPSERVMPVVARPDTKTLFMAEAGRGGKLVLINGKLPLGNAAEGRAAA
jgi:hypothetical protein